MRAKKGATRAWFSGTEFLLLAICSISFLLFLGCLWAIPKTADANGRLLLVGAGALLSLCLPVAFLLRAAGGDSISYLGKLPKGASLWRIPMLALGGLLLGFLSDRLDALPFAKGELLLSRLPKIGGDPLVLTIVFAILAFSTALLPFGILTERLSRQGSREAILPSAFLYAALFASFCTSPIFLLFGIFLALLRLQTDSFLGVLLCNAALMAGILSSRLGFPPFSKESPVLAVVVALILGVLAAGLLFGAIDFGFWRRALRGARTSWKRLLPQLVMSCVAFAVSLALAAFVS